MIAGLASTLPAALSQRADGAGRPRRGRRADRRSCRRWRSSSPRSSATTRSSSCSGRCSPRCPPDQASYLTGRSFFPQLITGPFSDGLTAAFWFAIVACLVAAVASWFTGTRSRPAARESVGAELAAESGELVRDGFAGPVPAGRLLGTLRRPDRKG